MFRRFGHVLLIVAVLAATGTHWLVLQSVAWTTMLAGNLQATSLCDAVERTFNGKNPCCLCKQITQGKQQEKKTEFRADWKKLEYPYVPATFTFHAPSSFHELCAADDAGCARPEVPRLPPPKMVLA